MNISYVILTWNSERTIAKCLTSLLDDIEQSGFSYQIFIVDNGSKDKTRQILSSFTERHKDTIVPIYLDRNMGTTYSRNIALKQIEGDYVVIMDSDIEIPGRTIGRLVKFLEGQRDAGLVAPRLIYPSGRLQKSTDHFPTVITKVFRYFFLRQMERIEERKKEQRKAPFAIDYAISAFWVLRREVLSRVGYLDEKIFYAPEDVDYCLRVWSQGFKIYYHPDISVIHAAQELSRSFRINKATLQHIKGLCHYFMKHRYLLKRPLFPESC